MSTNGRAGTDRRGAQNGWPEQRAEREDVRPAERPSAHGAHGRRGEIRASHCRTCYRACLTGTCVPRRDRLGGSSRNGWPQRRWGKHGTPEQTRQALPPSPSRGVCARADPRVRWESAGTCRTRAGESPGAGGLRRQAKDWRPATHAEAGAAATAASDFRLPKRRARGSDARRSGCARTWRGRRPLPRASRPPASSAVRVGRIGFSFVRLYRQQRQYRSSQVCGLFRISRHWSLK